VGLIGLVIALIQRSRTATVATLALVFLSALSAWPVSEYGEKAYDRVLTMTDDDGRAWLEEHQHRADNLIVSFYGLAALAAIALVAPLKWPKSSVALALAVLLSGCVVLGMGGYIAYAGGKIRHREFRNEPPPKRVPAEEPSSPTP
jgi:hypothetical protein